MHNASRMQKLKAAQHAVHDPFDLRYRNQSVLLFNKTMEVLFSNFKHKKKSFYLINRASRIENVEEFYYIGVPRQVLQDRHFAEQSFRIQYIMKSNFLDSYSLFSGNVCSSNNLAITTLAQNHIHEIVRTNWKKRTDLLVK